MCVCLQLASLVREALGGLCFIGHSSIPTALVSVEPYHWCLVKAQHLHVVHSSGAIRGSGSQTAYLNGSDLHRGQSWRWRSAALERLIVLHLVPGQTRDAVVMDTQTVCRI